MTQNVITPVVSARRVSGVRARCRVLVSALAVTILALSPLKIDVQINTQSDSSLTTAGLEFTMTFAQAYAADRRGGRSGDRSGRGGGKGADRRGLDRNDTPGNGDAASSSSSAGRSGSSSNSNSGSNNSDRASSNGSGTASADAPGQGEGREAAESEGGDRSPRSWFSIDASDMDTLNVGVIASRMGKASTDPLPDLCVALVCHDVR